MQGQMSIKNDIYGTIREAFIGIKYGWPLLLRHHPFCDDFRYDVFPIGYTKLGDKTVPESLCIGCFTAYPIGLFTFLILICNAYFGIPFYLLFGIGVLLGLFNLISILGHTNGRVLKTLVKIPMGFGLGFTAASITSFSSLLAVPYCCISGCILFMAFFTVLSFFSSLRLLKLEKHCERCAYKKNWKECPGLGHLHKVLEEAKSNAQKKREKKE